MSSIAKGELKALERVFAAEVDGRLPFQSKAKVYSTMQGYGWVEPMKIRIGSPPFTCTVEGWALTHAGRMLYCAHC